MITIKNEFKNTAVTASETDFLKRIKQIRDISVNASDAEIETTLGITFDTFERCIEQIKRYFEFSDKLYEIGIDIAEVPADKVCDNLVDLLEAAMGDTHNHWISFFIYNMDFGSRADAVTVMDDDKEVSLSSTRELWDLLVHKIGEEIRKELVHEIGEEIRKEYEL